MVKRKEKIFTALPIVILIIQLIFHAEYLSAKTMGLFYDFEPDVVLNICFYIIDIVAIIALFIQSRRLLSIYWISRIMYSIYYLIAVSYNGDVLKDWFMLLFEMMMYILALSSSLELSQTSMKILKETHYIPIVLFAVVALDVIIKHESGLSTIINYCLSGVAYFCMAHWCTRITDKQ